VVGGRCPGMGPGIRPRFRRSSLCHGRGRSRVLASLGRADEIVHPHRKLRIRRVDDRTAHGTGSHRPVEFAGRSVPTARVGRPTTIRIRSEGSPGVGRTKCRGPSRNIRHEQFRVRRSVHTTRRTFSILAPIRHSACRQMRRAQCGIG